MAMAFGGPGGYFDVSYAAWADILDLAETYGWTPVGTEPPEGSTEEDEWSGTYYSSDGQRISDRDALDLASAIEAFLSGEPPTTEAPATMNPERASFGDFLARASEVVGAPSECPEGPLPREGLVERGRGSSFPRQTCNVLQGGRLSPMVEVALCELVRAVSAQQAMKADGLRSPLGPTSLSARKNRSSR